MQLNNIQVDMGIASHYNCLFFPNMLKKVRVRLKTIYIFWQIPSKLPDVSEIKYGNTQIIQVKSFPRWVGIITIRVDVICT